MRLKCTIAGALSAVILASPLLTTAVNAVPTHPNTNPNAVCIAYYATSGGIGSNRDYDTFVADLRHYSHLTIDPDAPCPYPY